MNTNKHIKAHSPTQRMHADTHRRTLNTIANRNKIFFNQEHKYIQLSFLFLFHQSYETYVYLNISILYVVVVCRRPLFNILQNMDLWIAVLNHFAVVNQVEEY